MSFKDIAMMVLGGLAIGIGHSLVEAIRQAKSTSPKKQEKPYTKASDQVQIGITQGVNTVLASLSETHPSCSHSVQQLEVDILNVAVPDAYLRFEEVVDTLGVVIPVATFELEDAFDAVVADVVIEGRSNTQVSPVHQQNVVYASDMFETDDTSEKTQSQPHVSTSTSLTLGQPVNDPCLLQVASTLPITSCSSSAKTCTAWILYEPAGQVNRLSVPFAAILDQVLSTLTSQQSVDTTPITTPLPSFSAGSSQSSTSTALVLYRSPIHLDTTFMFNQAWSRLLAIASYDIEQFWQRTVSDLCTSVYRDRVAFDLLTLLHRGVEDVATTPRHLVEVSHVVIDRTGAEKFLLEHAPSVEADNHTNDFVSENSEFHQQTSLVAAVIDSQASFETSPDQSLECSTDDSLISSTSHENVDESLISANWSSQCSNAEASSNEAILKIIEEKQQLETALQHQEAVSSSLRTQLVECEEALNDTKEKLREAERRCDMYAEESDDTSQQVRNLQQQLAAAKRQLDEKNKAQPLAPQTPQIDHSAAGFNVAAITAARDQAQKEAQHNLAQWKFVEQMLNEVIAERNAWKCEAEELRHADNEVNQPLLVLNHHFRDDINGLQGQVEQLKQLKEAADDRVKVVERYNKNLLSEYAIKHAQDPQLQLVPGNCKPNEVQDLRQALDASMHNHEKANDANAQLQDMLQEKDKEIIELRSDKKLIKDRAARYGSYLEVIKGRLQAFMRAFPASIERRLGVDIKDIEGVDELLQEYEAREIESIELFQEADEKLSALDRDLVNEQRRHGAEIEDLTKNVAELRNRNIELDGLNFQSEGRLMHKDQEMLSLKENVKLSDELAKEWRVAAEDKAYGNWAGAIRDTQERELQSLRAQVEAVQWKAYELDSALEQARGESWDCRIYFARMMEGVRRQGYLSDWRRQQVEALRERFQVELVARPLNVAYKPDWSDLPVEEQKLLAEADNEVILRLTGIDMQLGLDNNSEHKELSVGELWSGLYDEYERVTGMKAEA